MGLQENGYVDFRGYKTYYEIYGEETSKPPLLALHGGPGSPHNMIVGLAELALGGRQIVFYDQLGCGLSDHPEDDSLWKVETYVNELETVREQLGLDDIHLFGHSWGGMLAIDYLLTKPEGVQSVILASSMISMPLFQAEAEKLKQALPLDVYQALKRHEAAGTTDSEEYQAAYQHYRDAYIYSGGPRPSKFRAADEKKGDDVYKAMWGASEAFANGTLKHWDRIDRLGEISIPTLITSGQFDELTPCQAELTREKIADSQLVIFTAGTHLVHIEQQTEYLKTIDSFLAQVES